MRLRTGGGTIIDGPRVRVPRTADKGEVIQVRTKIPHPMETGWRKDIHGETVPQNRINKFVCKFNGTEVFSADLFSGASADPYISFFVRATENGTFTCEWQADGEKTFSQTASLTVV